MPPTTKRPPPSTKPVPLVEVPDVDGDHLQDALRKLSRAGFRADVQLVEVDRDRDVGRVISQDPDGGEDAPEGSTVTLKVGMEKPED